VVTIGTFDGVHAGHRALLATARARALALTNSGRPTRVVALAFDPHPMTRLKPDAAPARLSTFAQREGWLRDAGADEVFALEPTDALLSLSPEAFILRVIERHAAVAFVEGPDFHFGAQRAGNVRALAALGAGLGFNLDVVEPVDVTLDNQHIVRASSTLVRWLVRQGRVADAAAVLGRPYELDGVVTQGDRLGRTIGFPTINIETSCMTPGDGVYAGVARVPAAHRAAHPAAAHEYLAAINVGARPTVRGVSHRIEAHLLAPSPTSRVPTDGSALAGLPEYGWPVRLSVHAFVRDQVRFESVQHLAAQLARDIGRVRARHSARAPHTAHA
jgi:riboflavin kinase/FMN adenylyltransferase